MATLDAAAAELRKLYKRGKRSLRPARVVAAARDPDSPLHKFFCWDDSKAAAEFRLIQARQLIARVRLTIPAGSGEVREVRAYHAVRSKAAGYSHLEDVLASAELKAALLSQMAADLERVRERYASLESIAAARRVLEVIEEFVGTRRRATETA